MALLDNVVAAWRLEEASGTRVDEVGSNDLTDNNTVTQAAGKLGNAAQFTQANSEYLSIADNTDLSMGNIDFAIAYWLYLDTGSTGILSKDADTGSQREYGFYNSSGANFYTFDPASTFRVVTASTFGALSTATWYFIVGWHDAGADTLNICVNDGTVDSAAAGSTGVRDDAAPFTLGKQGASNYHNGRLDMPIVRKGSIFSASEITQLYNGGAGLDPTAAAGGQAPRSMQQFRHRRVA